MYLAGLPEDFTGNRILQVDGHSSHTHHTNYPNHRVDVLTSMILVPFSHKRLWTVKLTIFPCSNARDIKYFYSHGGSINKTFKEKYKEKMMVFYRSLGSVFRNIYTDSSWERDSLCDSQNRFSTETKESDVSKENEFLKVSNKAIIIVNS